MFRLTPAQEAKAKGPSGEVDALQKKLQRIDQELDAANKVPFWMERPKPRSPDWTLF